MIARSIDRKGQRGVNHTTLEIESLTHYCYEYFVQHYTKGYQNYIQSIQI